MQSFYTALFGWEFKKWDGPMEYWTITTGDDADKGINGGLVKRMGQPPIDNAAVNAFVCTVRVENVDAALQKLNELGGIIAVPKMPIPGMGWLGYGKDPEGNIFGVMQDPSAK